MMCSRCDQLEAALRSSRDNTAKALELLGLAFDILARAEPAIESAAADDPELRVLSLQASSALGPLLVGLVDETADMLRTHFKKDV